MSRAAPTDFERAQLMMPCGYCGMPAGLWCRTVTDGHLGAQATWLHANRWDQVREVGQLAGWLARLAAVRRGLQELINDGSDDAAWLLIRLRELLEL